MKTLLFILLLLTSSLMLHAQAPAFSWAKQVGGSGYETGTSMVQDASGNIYTTGVFRNTVDFDPGPGSFFLTAAEDNIFILKLDINGNFIWAKHCSNISAGASYGAGIALDAQNNIYVTGTFSGTVDFDPGPASLTISANTVEIFVLKLDVNGNFTWLRQLGEQQPGSGSQGRGSCIKIDPSGNVIVAGTYHGIGDFDPGPGILNLGTSTAASCTFMTKLDANGNLLWAKATEGGSFTPDVAMVLDNSGNIFVTAGFNGATDFDPGTGIFTLVSTAIASTSIFIFKLEANGNFSWAKMMAGGPGFGASIVTDNAGNVYSTGKFAGTVDFDPGPGTNNLVYTGTANIYISRLNNAGNFTGARQLGGNSDSEGTGISIGSNGSVYITGIFSGKVDFDPGSLVYELSSTGSSDAFVAKLNLIGNLDWAVRMGGTGNARSNAIITDDMGSVYTCGHFDQTVDFDFTPVNYSLSSNGANDLFIHKIISCIGSIPTQITASACAAYTLNAQTYTATGTYTQMLTNTTGCDSTIILNLTIGATRTQLNIATCDNSYSMNGHTYTSSGTYNDTLINAAGCDSIITLNLLIGQKSSSNFSKQICKGESYLGYTATGIYTDTLTTANGCDSIRTLDLTVKENCLSFAVPNAFTPNNDKNNDLFKPLINEVISGYSLIIFNRYGEKMFETREYSSGWNGTYKGIDQPAGSYIYIIRYRKTNGLLAEEKGHLTLFR